MWLRLNMIKIKLKMLSPIIEDTVATHPIFFVEKVTEVIKVAKLWLTGHPISANSFSNVLWTVFDCFEDQPRSYIVAVSFYTFM